MRTGSRNARWTVLVAAIVTAVVAAVFGYWGAAPATAAPSTFTYDTAAYVYDAPALLSSQSQATTYARGSPSGPVAVSWGRSVSVRDDGDAANTASPTRVFWSGGRTAQTAAEKWVLENGGTTLEMTPAGRAVTSGTQDLPWSQAKPLWDQASAEFANGASGTAQVFHNAEGVSLNSVWRNVEYPILQRNGVGMNFHTVGEGW